jgi:hypothetical protein
MKNFALISLFLLATLSLFAQKKEAQPVYQDKAFIQDYSIKYYWPKGSQTMIIAAHSDRNKDIKLLSNEGLFLPRDGQFLHPGSFIADKRYRTQAPKQVRVLSTFENQFVFADDKAVFSQAWAGRVYAKHELAGVTLLAASGTSTFLLSDGTNLHVLEEGKTTFKTAVGSDRILEIRFHAPTGSFFVLGTGSLSQMNPVTKSLITLVK